MDKKARQVEKVRNFGYNYDTRMHMNDPKPYTPADLDPSFNWGPFGPRLRVTVEALERVTKERDAAREAWRSLAAGEVFTAGIAALVDRMTATHIEKARRLTAKVERLKKERAEDEAFESESEKLWGECEEDLDAARTEVERLKAAMRGVLFHAANPPLHPYEVSRRWTALQRAREALRGEVKP